MADPQFERAPSADAALRCGPFRSRSHAAAVGVSLLLTLLLVRGAHSWAEPQGAQAAAEVGSWLGSVMGVVPVVDSPARPSEPLGSPVADRDDATGGGAAVEHQGAPARRAAQAPRKRSRVAQSKPLHVPRGAVLRLANARLMPGARYVAATSIRPAGLQLGGVNGMGIGVRDGDVITHVAGMPMSTVGQVVSLVLQLRAKQVPAIDGILWRGRERYALSVEMPYLEARPAEARPDRNSHQGLPAPDLAVGTQHGENGPMHQTQTGARGPG